MAVKRAINNLCAVAIALLIGCSAMNKSRTKTETDVLLDVAINAMDSGSEICLESEFSTEDQEVLQIIRDRDFTILAHDVVKQGDDVIYQFILNHKGTGLLVSADVMVVDGECREYTFARIAAE